MDTNTEHKTRIRGPKGICTLSYIPEDEEGKPSISLSRDGDRLYTCSWNKANKEAAFNTYIFTSKILELTWQE